MREEERKGHKGLNKEGGGNRKKMRRQGRKEEGREGIKRAREGEEVI